MRATGRLPSLLAAAALAAAAPPETGVEAELARAAGLLEAGEPARAAEAIRALLPRQDTGAVRNLLGDALEAAGDLMGAAEEFQKAAHAEPSEEHLFDWGNCLLQLRAWEPASRVLVESINRHPRSARLHVALGIARYSRGQFEEAIRSFATAADLEPDDPRPYLFLGEMYGVSAQLSGEVTRRLAVFVRRQPAHALGHFYYAMSLWKGEPGAAPPPEVESHLKKAIALDAGLARAHFQLGVLYADARRYAEAVAPLEEAARLEPSMAQAHYRLSQVYRRTGREGLARKALETFERLQPK
jgi:tetratricopeptide (TPR) repeat protein